MIAEIANKVRAPENACSSSVLACIGALARWERLESSISRFTALGRDLSQKLAADCDYLTDYPEGNLELPRVAMSYELKPGKGSPGTLQQDPHRGRGRQKGLARDPCARRTEFPLIVTTNFDSFFEDSLPAHKKADIRIYEPKPNTESPAPDFGTLTENTPGILKIHGDFSRPDSLVITDEDYIHFVMRMRDEETINPFTLTPRFLMSKLSTLFIGYSLLDYNVRLFLKTLRFRLDPANIPASYSVDPCPDKMVRMVWQDQRRWVWFVDEDVWSFVPALYKAVTNRDMPQ